MKPATNKPPDNQLSIDTAIFINLLISFTMTWKRFSGQNVTFAMLTRYGECEGSTVHVVVRLDTNTSQVAWTFA